MIDLASALALWALVSGVSLAVGALSRVALDAWEAKERARRLADGNLIYGMRRAAFDSRRMNLIAMDAAWAPESGGEAAPTCPDDAPALGDDLTT